MIPVAYVHCPDCSELIEAESHDPKEAGKELVRKVHAHAETCPKKKAAA